MIQYRSVEVQIGTLKSEWGSREILLDPDSSTELDSVLNRYAAVGWEVVTISEPVIKFVSLTGDRAFRVITFKHDGKKVDAS